MWKATSFSKIIEWKEWHVLTFTNLFKFGFVDDSWIPMLLPSICCNMLFWWKYIKGIMTHSNMQLEKRGLQFASELNLFFYEMPYNFWKIPPEKNLHGRMKMKKASKSLLLCKCLPLTDPLEGSASSLVWAEHQLLNISLAESKTNPTSSLVAAIQLLL